MKRLLYLILLVSSFTILIESCYNDDGNLPTSSFTDARDGTIYQTVTIGDQVWMAENLKYLPIVVGPDMGSLTTPYSYVNDFFGSDVNNAKGTENFNIYGVLYNYPAAMNGALSSIENPSGIQGICPDGWHLPSNAEWQELVNFIGGEANADLLIKTDTNKWAFPNENATNEFGFSALPGGSFSNSGNNFSSVGLEGYWWTSQEFEEENALLFRLSDENIVVIGFSISKASGFSVRCVKD
ncbi:FISUMP domain-containing protein [Paucihalobacter sp.]|uniref:FISUMP domain-containing protein n=1 Tax=Paucihalobacter sp. TaxID=2850405 RepID=UPI002FE28F28